MDLIFENKKTKQDELRTLQVQGHNCLYKDNKKNLFYNFGGVKVSQKICNGSVTIEATIVLSIFILVIYSCMFLFVYINFGNEIDFRLFTISKNIMKYEYLIDKGSSTIESISKKDNELINDRDLIHEGINATYMYSKLLSNNMVDLIDKSNVEYGIAGINIMDTKFKIPDGSLDLRVKYSINVPVIGTDISIKDEHRVYFRPWIGKSIDVKTKKKDQIVYITKNGKVYHLNRDCTYISINTVKVNIKDIFKIRNNSGAKYYACNRCIKKRDYQEVYITLDGNRYHSSNKCSSILRNVIEIDISEIGDRSLCKKCAKEVG